MDWTPIIVAAIAALPPTLATLLTAKTQRRLSKMHAAKQSILQMQMEDVIAVELLHKLPVNHTNIKYEYDEYHKNGGNSDIDEKMEEYENWYRNIDFTKFDKK